MASDLIQMYFILFVKSSFINSILEVKTFVAKDKIQGLFDTTNRYCLYSKYVNIAVNTGHKLFKSKTCSLNSTIFQVAIHFIPPTVVMYVRFFISTCKHDIISAIYERALEVDQPYISFSFPEITTAYEYLMQFGPIQSFLESLHTIFCENLYHIKPSILTLFYTRFR